MLLLPLALFCSSLIVSCSANSDDPFAQVGNYKDHAAHTKRLLDYLFNKDYDPHLKPTRNLSTTIVVNVTIDLFQIVQVAESLQSMTLATGVNLRWYDEHLFWNPDDFGGVSVLVVPANDVWYPDFVLDNSMRINPNDYEPKRNIRLSVDPSIDYIDHSIVDLMYTNLNKFTCKYDITYFPFDYQKCTMYFSSWMYGFKGIRWNPLMNTTQNEIYVDDGGWHLIRTEVISKKVKTFWTPGLEPEFSLVVVHIVLKRRPLYYVVNMVLPTVFVSLVAVIGLFAPIEDTAFRTAKISIGLNTAMAMLFFVIFVSDAMPISANVVPLINIYFLSILVLICIACTASTFVLNVQRRGLYSYEISTGWLVLCNRVAPVLHFNTMVFRDMRSTHGESKQKPQENDHSLVGIIKDDALRRAFVKVHYELDVIQTSIEKLIRKTMIAREWAYIADVLDSLFLIAFLFADIGITCAFFLIGMSHLKETI